MGQAETATSDIRDLPYDVHDYLQVAAAILRERTAGGLPMLAADALFGPENLANKLDEAAREIEAVRRDKGAVSSRLQTLRDGIDAVGRQLNDVPLHGCDKADCPASINAQRALRILRSLGTAT